MTESLQKEKVVKAREVAGQSVGHFIGKVAGGKPPYFNIYSLTPSAADLTP